jgi:hypothetical protein
MAGVLIGPKKCGVERCEDANFSGFRASTPHY